MNPSPTLPAGYRLVADDEVIQEGDQCSRTGGVIWTQAMSSVGETPGTWHREGRYTDLIWATARSAPVPVEKEWLNPWD